MKRIKISPRTGYRKIGDKFVIFSCDSHQIAILNDSAELLWERMSEWISLGDLIRLLVDNFQVGKKQAIKDTKTFIFEMAKLGMIIVGNNEELLETRNNKKDKQEEGGNLLLEIEKHAIPKTIPFATTFEVTYQCNEKCIHCYMERKPDLLTTRDIKRILTELKKESCLFVSFTGGEVLTRPDFAEIMSFAGANNFVIDVLTNGTLINDKVVETILQNPVRRIQVSLYGSNSETHDMITRIPGSFKKTLNGIRLLREADIKVEVAFTVMGLNFEERYEVKKIAENLGCLLLPSHLITARNNRDQTPWSLRVSDAQLENFMSDEKLFILYSGRRPFQEHQFYLGFNDLKEANPCYSGINSCAINPEGRVFPCNQLLFELGDCKSQSFSEIWHNSSGIGWLRSIKVKNLPKCSNCSLLPYCSRCPGLAYIENGDILGPSSENCRIAKIWTKIQNERR